ncbi:unnamed protein product [Polarella glacialis]|uniref:BEACH domain-containing protein n=1 Tax=Polarella glacialis TaxID=89957 RepID=A0A813E8R9_POLGL|nr:unnamed protein product [Polarella glacialis]
MEDPPYHYGTHYSTPAFVMHWMVRLQPFTQLAQDLQGGHHDVADRIFYSLPESSRSCLTEMSDVRELIPELFVIPECLMNCGNLNLGVRQDGQKVSAVELPSWATDAYHFVHEHRLALESPVVSAALHLWVDLIWGCRQNGENAREALNVFYPLTYETGVDWSSLEPIRRHATEQQVLHFGQTPRQVFFQKHQPKLASSWGPSLLRPRGGGTVVVGGQADDVDKEDIGTVHSSACGMASSTAMSWPRGSPVFEGRLSVVAVATQAPPLEGEAARLFVLQSDGILRCCRVRQSHPVSSVVGGGGAMAMALSFASSGPGLDSTRTQVDLEAKFRLPCCTDGWDALLTDQQLLQRASAWVLLPERRFFARGGFTDGSLLYGGTNGQEARLSAQAHESPISALAVSEDAARRVRGAKGLLLASGDCEGSVRVWAYQDSKPEQLLCVARWHLHLDRVNSLDFGDAGPWLLSAGEDGLVHLYRLRPPARPLRTFRFQQGLPVSEARFASRAPATVVACCAAAGLICVWALHGFLLATVQLSSLSLCGLRVISENDAREALLCATASGDLELRSLPYLGLVWRRRCAGGVQVTAIEASLSPGRAWVGLEDGTFQGFFPMG